MWRIPVDCLVHLSHRGMNGVGKDGDVVVVVRTSYLVITLAVHSVLELDTLVGELEGSFGMGRSDTDWRRPEDGRTGRKGWGLDDGHPERVSVCMQPQIHVIGRYGVGMIALRDASAKTMSRRAAVQSSFVIQLDDASLLRIFPSKVVFPLDKRRGITYHGQHCSRRTSARLL